MPAARAAEFEAAGIERRPIHSGDSYFDVIPAGAGKAEAMRRVADCLGVTSDHVVVAGDSGNARAVLRDRVESERAYVARAHYAAEILEGLSHWGLRPDRSD